MGCCIRSQDKIIIKSSSVLLSDRKSLENEEKNNFRKNTNIVSKIVIPKQKKKSADLIIHKKNKKDKKNKFDKRNIKSMKALREISYNEVNESTKYF